MREMTDMKTEVGLLAGQVHELVARFGLDVPPPPTTMTAVVASISDMPLRARLTWGLGWVLGLTIGQVLAALFPSRVWHFGHISVDGWKCRLIKTVKR